VTAGNTVHVAVLATDSNNDGIGDTVAATPTYSVGLDQDAPSHQKAYSGLHFDATDLASAGYPTTDFWVHIVAKVGNNLKRDFVFQAPRADTPNPNINGAGGFKVANGSGKDSSSEKDGGSGVCFPCIALGIGGFALLVLFVLLFVVFRRRRNEKKQARQYESEENSNSL
jgi:hypothetical protein